ncbi:hypothetical protein CHELA1G11_13348 [Hyphomicrobiales bacterium]|nr:hypothetical protein CHELA1G11_13348 [Hyphomicrobiales bacterium]
MMAMAVWMPLGTCGKCTGLILPLEGEVAQQSCDGGGHDGGLAPHPDPSVRGAATPERAVSSSG